MDDALSMRWLFFCLALSTLPLPALAGMAEAKNAAHENGCKPSAVVAIDTATGTGDSTTYKITCALSGTPSEEQKKSNGTLYVRCYGTLCTLLKKGE